MAKKRRPSKTPVTRPAQATLAALFVRVQRILEEARAQVVRTVNTEMVRAYWLIGREIVEEEQQGRARTGYGEALIDQLSAQPQARFGKWYTRSNLQDLRQLYLTFPRIPRVEFDSPPPRDSALAMPIRHAPRGEFGLPGQLNANLSWTHHRLLMKVESDLARSFYEVEAGKSHWSSREQSFLQEDAD